jgi:hypothetical protein
MAGCTAEAQWHLWSWSGTRGAVLLANRREGTSMSQGEAMSQPQGALRLKPKLAADATDCATGGGKASMQAGSTTAVSAVADSPTEAGGGAAGSGQGIMREATDGAMVAAAAAVAAEQHRLVKEAVACTTKISHDGQDLSFAEVVALGGFWSRAPSVVGCGQGVLS